MRRCRALALLASLLVLAGSQAAFAQDAGLTAPSEPRAASRPKPKSHAPSQAPSQPIMIYDARIEAGDLRISGSVRKGGAIVVMDEDISIQADRRGRFVFRLPYRPATCVVTLKSDEDEREAVIANCAPEGQPGPKGETGAIGATGPQGEAGIPGVPGPKGEAGPKGETGSQGEAGAKGDMGPKGEAGVKGDMGPKGEAGAKGEAGPKGDTGPKGGAGPSGPAGLAGSGGSTPLRAVRAETCGAGGCTVACERGEVFVSAYCLRSGSPAFSEPEGTPSATCPGEAAGMVGICGRL